MIGGWDGLKVDLSYNFGNNAAISKLLKAA